MKNKKNIYVLKPAFTMLELIMVIIILGILSSLAIPRMDRDYKQEASDSMLSHIRYTQHLALTDNKHKFDKAKWQQRFWRIVFGTCTGNNRFFMIGTDDNMETSSNAFFSRNEAAIDPSTSKPFFWVSGQACPNGGDGTSSEEVFISKKYGIKTILAGGGCAGTTATMGHIGFDNFGRPHYGFGSSTQPNYNSLITQACTFTFTLSDDDTFSITIQPETGYAQIVGQNAS